MISIRLKTATVHDVIEALREAPRNFERAIGKMLGKKWEEMEPRADFHGAELSLMAQVNAPASDEGPIVFSLSKKFWNAVYQACLWSSVYSRFQRSLEFSQIRREISLKVMCAENGWAEPEPGEWM